MWTCLQRQKFHKSQNIMFQPEAKAKMQITGGYIENWMKVSQMYRNSLNINQMRQNLLISCFKSLFYKTLWMRFIELVFFQAHGKKKKVNMSPPISPWL